MNKYVKREKIPAMYRRGLSTVEIGKRMGLSPGAVQSILEVRGVKRRTSKQAHKIMWPKGRRGHLAGNWRGGRRFTGTGYVMIYQPKHPLCDHQGYVMEHRLVMENKLGRYLTKEEVVHHKNGKKADNRISNLEYIKNKSAHVKKHLAAVSKLYKLQQEVKRLKRQLRQKV